jgi:hypothetical protein
VRSPEHGLPELSVGALRLLRDGELEVRGRLVVSSNAALFCTASLAPDDAADKPRVASVVYKPIRFERPLWDFPDGTLAHREVAAFLVSEATGWGIVPPTVLRDGPAGPGMVQLWIDEDETADAWELVQAADPRLRSMAVFDAVVNNTDRKGSHILPVRLDRAASELPSVGPGREGDLHLFGVDHGVCFSDEPKLRTVLWAWRGSALAPGELDVLRRLRADLDADLGRRLDALLDPAEIEATRDRVDALLADGLFPQPIPDRPAIPWPPF